METHWNTCTFHTVWRDRDLYGLSLAARLTCFRTEQLSNGGKRSCQQNIIVTLRNKVTTSTLYPSATFLRLLLQTPVNTVNRSNELRRRLLAAWRLTDTSRNTERNTHDAWDVLLHNYHHWWGDDTSSILPITSRCELSGRSRDNAIVCRVGCLGTVTATVDWREDVG